MLITINQEDYELAKTKMNLANGGQVYYVPGVGIDLEQYQLVAETNLRSILDIKETDVTE